MSNQTTASCSVSVAIGLFFSRNDEVKPSKHSIELDDEKAVILHTDLSALLFFMYIYIY